MKFVVLEWRPGIGILRLDDLLDDSYLAVPTDDEVLLRGTTPGMADLAPLDLGRVKVWLPARQHLSGRSDG